MSKTTTGALALLVLLLAFMRPPFLNNIPIAQAASVPNTILVVVNSSGSSPFGAYLGEILHAEGWNSYDLIELSTLTSALLNQHDLTILGDTALTSGQATLFQNYVNDGGRLIAMRPDSQIRSLFGLSTSSGTQTDGYLGMSGSGVSAGLPTTTLQIHGTADKLALIGGTTTVATLYSSATTATGFPAVVSANSGRTAAFTYDLARSIIYMRQGNPANGGVDVDGDGVLRTIDLFQTAGGGSWVDKDRIPIPQADEQMRLLSRLIRQALTDVTPMPQLWYFPDGVRTMLISTSDAHANPVSWYTTLVDIMNQYGAKITFYISLGQVDVSTFEAWRVQGHEFGIHPYWYRLDSYAPYNVTNLTEGYNVGLYWWGLNGLSGNPSKTVRNHQVAWQGWTDAAQIAVNHGMALDTNFYHWGGENGWLKKADNTWPHGYITGSGLPMKFITSAGTVLPYYQLLTELVDENLVAGASNASTLENLSSSGATAVSQELIDASQNGYYSALMTQFHVDYIGAIANWVDGTLAYAQSQGVPMWNADRWLSFTQARDASTLQNISWNGPSGTLTFHLNGTATSGINLSVMLPASYNGGALNTVSVDGSSASYTLQTIKGQSMAFVNVASGNHSFSLHYNTTVAATNTPTGTLVPSATYTPTNTPTNTPIPPTATYTYTPIPPTATYTYTPIPPTATYTYTPIPPTATYTYTPIPPTATATNTPTDTPTATYTNTPTDTPTATNTPTNTPTYTPTYTLTPSNTPTITLTFNPLYSGDSPAIQFFTGNSVTLSWTRVSSAVSYHVQVSMNTAFSPLVYEMHIPANANPPLSLVYNPTVSGVYYWRVRAEYANKTVGTWSAVSTFTSLLPLP